MRRWSSVTAAVYCMSSCARSSSALVFSSTVAASLAITACSRCASWSRSRAVYSMSKPSACCVVISFMSTSICIWSRNTRSDELLNADSAGASIASASRSSMTERTAGMASAVNLIWTSSATLYSHALFGRVACRRTRVVGGAQCVDVEDRRRHPGITLYDREPRRRRGGDLVEPAARPGRRPLLPAEHGRDRLHHQVHRRVVGPVGEDFLGLGQGHRVDHAIGVPAAGGEGAVDAGELGAAVAAGTASPDGASPAALSIPATAALTSSSEASIAKTASSVSAGSSRDNPAWMIRAAASTRSPPPFPGNLATTSSTTLSCPSVSGRIAKSRPASVTIVPLIRWCSPVIHWC